MLFWWGSEVWISLIFKLWNLWEEFIGWYSRKVLKCLEQQKLKEKTETGILMYMLNMKFLSTEPKTRKLSHKKGSNTATLRRVLLTQAKVTMLNIFKDQWKIHSYSQISVR